MKDHLRRTLTLDAVPRAPRRRVHLRRRPEPHAQRDRPELQRGGRERRPVRRRAAALPDRPAGRGRQRRPVRELRHVDLAFAFLGRRVGGARSPRPEGDGHLRGRARHQDERHGSHAHAALRSPGGLPGGGRHVRPGRDLAGHGHRRTSRARAP